MDTPKYIVGIDLGTTHCVMAFTEADVPTGETPEVHLFEIPQVVGAGEVMAKPLLPSFLLMPGPHDVPEGALALPWQPDATDAVGTFARERGGELPTRLVASAKSWLCHSGVDRTQPILPWEAPSDARKVSPVAATTRYLIHLRDAWNHHMAATDTDVRLEQQDVYLTVPASFDAVARELTVAAAQAVGFTRLTLLEEPQAAFYAWLNANQDAWREAVGVGASILVFDVGGGTTDLSLIQMVEEDGSVALQRTAVGDHILLGGDNMDLTLAYALRAKLAQGGTQIDNWQFKSLWQQCRKAKESLLNDPDHTAEPVVLLGRGSSLIGGTIRTELTRDELHNILVQGFFPHVEAHEQPQQQARVGMREMGLPYAADPAITRHLAAFLARQGDGGTYPSAVLFNGGVMKAEPLRKQVMDVLRHWSGNADLKALSAVDLDQAVALGAAYYGHVRQGQGIRIRAGAARSYYIGVESAMPAVPGIPTPMKAVCVVPFGMEEGTEARIDGQTFGLVVGEAAAFHLLGTTIRKTDQAGEVIDDWGGELQEVATMEANLPTTETDAGGTVIPIWLESRVTEVGTLELWCVAQQDDRRWKLSFNIREEVVS